jgi:hypothetical protein
LPLFWVVVGEFNLQVQQLNSFSLQRSDMFIATGTRRNLAPLGAKPGTGNFCRGSKSQLRSYGASEEKQDPSYKHLAPPGA